jgi:Tol biopolymer transport system component
VTAQWSPNGRWIAITSRSAETSDVGFRKVWVIHPNGHGLRPLTPVANDADWVAPVWSPNSKKLLFQRLGLDNMTSLWTVGLTGSHPTKLTDIPYLVEYDWGTAPRG